MQKLVLGGKFVNCNMHEKSKILQFFLEGRGQIRAKNYTLQLPNCLLHPSLQAGVAQYRP